MAPTLRPLPAHAPRHSSRPVRSSRTRVMSYSEDSFYPTAADADIEDSVDSGDIQSQSSYSGRRPLTHRERLPDGLRDEAPPLSKTASATNSPTKPKVTRASSSRAKRSLFLQTTQKISGITASKRKAAATVQTPLPIEPPAGIPPWTTLPYHILFEIFSRVISTVNGASSTPSPEFLRSVKWLIGVSRLCRAFFEPAMAALFYSPPVNVLEWSKGLRDLLAKDQDDLTINYRNKVKSLDIYCQYPNHNPASLVMLLYVTPQVKHLRLYDPSDTPRKSAKPLQCYFLDHWTEFMGPGNIHLHSWEWNCRVPFSDLKIYHLHPMFQTLRSLRFFQVSSYDPNRMNRNLSEAEADSKLSQELASAISVLPDLRELVFRQCSLIDDLLLILSVNLESLSIAECDDVESSSLESYIVHHGKSLRVLDLAHNRNLDMSFTASLQTSCPRLEEFSMDFNFTSVVTLAHDVEPYFDSLLLSGKTPSWPSTLQKLELERLRKWDVSTAEAVFNSLIDAAPYLKDLRTLVLTAILRIDWRGRAQFRDEWVRRLEHTFSRESAPPDPNLNTSTSKKQRQKQKHMDAQKDTTSDSSDVDVDTFQPRKSKSTESSIPIRKSRRLAKRKSIEESENSENLTDPGSSNGYLSSRQQNNSYAPTGKQNGLYVQGMCDTVRIRIDNLRPADVILMAENLTDAEMPGDDDWDGEDLDMNEDYAW